MAGRYVSSAVNVACKLAASEAVAAESPQVEPLHLLIGICSLEKLFSPNNLGKQLSRSELDGIGVEWSLTMSVFADAAINPILLRRTLRASAASSNRRGISNLIELSKQSLRILELAFTSAINRGFRAAGLLELLLAILGEEQIVLRLQAAGVDVERVLTHLFARSEASSSLLEIKESGSQMNHSLASDFESVGEIVAVKVNHPNEQVVVVQASQTPHSFTGLASLFEACWATSSTESSDKLAQNVLEQLLATIPSAQRGVILLTDASSGGLLLKAHFPAGSPVVSVSSAREAIDLRKAFIWTAENGIAAAQGLYAPLTWKNQVLGVICLDNGIAGTSFSSEDLELLSSFGHHLALVLLSLNQSVETRRTAALIQRLLMSFSPNLRTRVLDMARQGRLRPGGERSEVTILYADIRGFTLATAKMEADDVAEMLNVYLGVLTESIVNHHGTIDKYIGDAVLAVFGSPDPDLEQHAKALRAANDMQLAMGKVNEKRRTNGQLVCEIGIGIHCGEVFHGLIGAAERIEFTVIGDAVNRCSRYCSAASAGDVILSPDLYQRVWQLVEAERLMISTKHEGDVLAYRLVRLKSGETSVP
jgi:adenylate cyclase